MNNKSLTKEEDLRAKEVLKLLEEVSTLEEALKSKITLNDIRITRTYIIKRINLLKGQKKKYFYDSDFYNYEKCKEKISFYKKKFAFLGKLREEYAAISSIVSKNSSSIDKKMYAVNNILMLDFFFSSTDKELFMHFLEEKDTLKRIDILTKLRELYINATYHLYRAKKTKQEEIYKIIARENGLDGGLKKNRKEFSLLLQQERYRELRKELLLVKEQYSKSKRFLEELERLIKYEQKDCDNLVPKKCLEIDDTDYEEIIGDKCGKNFIKRLENIRDGKYIRKYGLGLEKFVPNEVLEVFNELEKLEDTSKEEACVLAIDVLKNKLRILKKGLNPYDDVERKFLKMLIKMFEDMRPLKIEEDVIDTSVYYDIVEALCHNDNNYSYIERLIRENSNIRNARKNNYHIIISLLDSYILSSKLKLAEQGFNFIEPDFYKEIIKAFYKNKVILTEEEQEIINSRLSEFEAYVNDVGRKKYGLVGVINKSIEDLRTCGFQQVKSDVDNDKLVQEISLLDFNKERVINNYMHKYSFYKDGSNSRVFMIDGIDNCCFSINYEDYRDVVFGVHFLDTSKLVEEDSEIVKAAMEGRNVLPKMEKGINPVMSFTCHFLDYKHFSEWRIEPGIVYVDKVYNSFDIDRYREDETLKNMYIFLNNFKDIENKESIYSTSGVKDVVFKDISNYLKKKFRDYKLPFIYEKTQEEAEDIIRVNHNSICDKLSKIPKKEAHRIFAVIDEEMDKYYVPRGDRKVDVSLDTSTFLGYYLMNILGKIQKNKYDIDKESENLKNYLEKLNGRRAYLPVGIIKNNEKKIRRMVRDYKKK